MLIQRAYRIELDPNKKQANQFAQACGVARFASNWGLQRRIEEYEKTGKTISVYELNKELNARKKTEFPWMYEVSKCAAQEGLFNMDAAYQNFFRRNKLRKQGSNQPAGFPRFKKKGEHDSFRINSRCVYGDTWVQVPRVGRVRYKGNVKIKNKVTNTYLPVNAKINSFTISTIAGRWFVSFQVEEEIKVPINLSKEVLAGDLGVKTLLTLSDGTKIKAPKPLAKRSKNIRKRNKRLSRKKKGGQNWKKAKLKLQKEHYKISCIRRDFAHKLTTSLVRTKPGTIVVEDLNVQGLIKNRRLSRAVSDVGWGEFIRQLTYKCAWHGITLIKADRFYPSSKLCSGCSDKKAKLTLKDRTYNCDNCGLSIDRDLNAALNLKKYPNSNWVKQYRQSGGN